MSRQDLDTLAELLRDRDLLLLSDEVYEHMVFDGAQHISVLSHEELREKSFAVFSFGKTYHATGWKLAYCIAPPILTAEFRKVHQFVTFTSVSFCAVCDSRFFCASVPQHADELPDFYQAKRDTFNELLAPSRFTLKPSAGTLLSASRLQRAERPTRHRFRQRADSAPRGCSNSPNAVLPNPAANAHRALLFLQRTTRRSKLPRRYFARYE